MKKILLGVFLGFLLFHSMTIVYNYTWWKCEYICRSSVPNELECIYEKMGYVRYLKYPLARINYPFQKWEIEYP